MYFKDIIAFGAKDFHPSYASGFLSAVAFICFVHGKAFSRAVRLGLDDETTLGIHSDIYHFSDRSAIVYTWGNPSWKPFGWVLPTQCPQCGAIRSNATSVDFGKRKAVTICKNIACSFRTEYLEPIGQQLLTSRAMEEAVKGTAYGVWYKRSISG